MRRNSQRNILKNSSFVSGVVVCVLATKGGVTMYDYHMVGNFNVLLRFAVPDVKTLDALVGKIKTFGDSRTSIEL